uniref:Uncharacterized protein n=1 Tax=Caenorhabditis tropicalis TaxID=1561998 RepID=A0A1I7UG37_9PELO
MTVKTKHVEDISGLKGKEETPEVTEEMILYPGEYNVEAPKVLDYLPSIPFYYFITAISILMMLAVRSSIPPLLHPTFIVLAPLFFISSVMVFFRWVEPLGVINHMELYFWITSLLFLAILYINDYSALHSVPFEVIPVDPFFVFVTGMIGMYRTLVENHIYRWMWFCKRQRSITAKTISTDGIINV